MLGCHGTILIQSVVFVFDRRVTLGCDNVMLDFGARFQNVGKFKSS
jgi:hypothetical protein